MIARQSFANIVLTLLEFIWFFDNPDRMDKYMEVPQKVIDEVGRIKRETGRGVILVVPHLGNWEVAGLMFSRFVKEPFAVIARTLRNPYLNNFINSTRMLDGNEVIPAKGSVRGLIKVLKKGYSAATLIDQNTRVRDGGIFVDFFGLPVPVSRAPAMFARKMNIPVYVAGCTRDGKSYRSFMEPLPKKASDYSGETELIQDIIKINEKLIRKHPEQYLWFYKRFQYIPADAPASTAVAYPYYSSRASKRFYSKPEARAGNREN
jgi:lauroyl/myristoyl acyltransferase